jgi:hypothetical protein
MPKPEKISTNHVIILLMHGEKQRHLPTVNSTVRGNSALLQPVRLGDILLHRQQTTWIQSF